MDTPTKEQLKLIKWANDGYPPIDLNNELRHIIALIKDYKSQQAEIERLEKENKALQESEDELCIKIQKEQDEAFRVWTQGEERDEMRLATIKRLQKELVLKMDSFTSHMDRKHIEVETLKATIDIFESYKNHHVQAMQEDCDELRHSLNIISNVIEGYEPNLMNLKEAWNLVSNHITKLESLKSPKPEDRPTAFFSDQPGGELK